MSLPNGASELHSPEHGAATPAGERPGRAVSHEKLGEVYATAYSEARKRRPLWISEDALQEATRKWWTRIRRDVPPYLLKHGELSNDLLVYWILHTAAERQRVLWRVEAIEVGGLDATGEDADLENAILTQDRSARPADDLIAGRLDARAELAALASARDIDPVLVYRAVFDLEYVEIAEILGITAVNARVRMLRSAARLRARLES